MRRCDARAYHSWCDDAGRRFALARVEKHQIDVRAVAHLARAEAAERQHGQARRWRSVARDQRRQRQPDALDDARLGDARELVGDRPGVERTGDVVQADAQHLLGLETA